VATIVQTIDDLHNSEDGEQVKADRTHRLRLDGRDVELDLTAAHHDELAKLLERYFKAGHRPQDAPPPREVPSHAKMSRNETRDLRAWADAQTPPLSYEPRGKGSYYYSMDLRRKWAAHKAEAGLRYE
jgi:hypothetical protein